MGWEVLRGNNIGDQGSKGHQSKFSFVYYVLCFRVFQTFLFVEVRIALAGDVHLPSPNSEDREIDHHLKKLDLEI